MTTLKNKDDGSSGSFNWQPQGSKNFTVNIEIELIATNPGTIKLCYNKLESQLKSKIKWLPCFGLTLACFTPLVTVSKFNTFCGIKEGFWQAIYFIISVSSFIWGICYARMYRHDPPSAEAFIKSIQEVSPPLSEQDRIKYLAMYGIRVETEQAFDQEKVYTLSEASEND